MTGNERQNTSILTVSFDVTWMNVENKAGGIFQYAFRLISALVAYTDINVVAIIGKGNESIFESLNGYKNFKTVCLENQRSFVDILKREKIDVVHTPKQNHHHYTVTLPMINTLHDLQPFYFPEYFSKNQIEWRNIHYKKSAEFSERVIVSFEHVKKDLVKYYNIPSEKIDICPIGISIPKITNGEKSPIIREKYRVPQNYLFYSANTWPHKNHINLVKALKILHDKYNNKIALVCTGQKLEGPFTEIKKTVEKLRLEDYVNFTGYIPEEDMMLLLKNSTLVVIPTLYEAGSFPLMEAMAYEVPVICSDVTSLPDTIGDSRFTFDPKNVEQMAEKIALMLKDKRLIEENRENSKKRVKEAGWDKVISHYIDSYTNAVDNFKQIKDTPYLMKKISNFEILINKQLEQKSERIKYLVALLNSISWKIIAPLRKIGRLFKGGKL